MLNLVDRFLNKITMYRLVFYYLIGLILVAAILGGLNILPYSPIAIIFSTAVLVAVCFVTNKICAIVFNAQPNVESVYITAFILTLIITPIMPLQLSALPFLIWAGVLAMVSKYILAINRKHIFNPAALAVAITGFTIGGYASWWVGGNLPLIVFVIIGGLLVIRKVQRGYMVGTFLLAATATIMATYTGNPLNSLPQLALHTPIFFFASIMLTEPATTPPTTWRRIAYGAFVGFLFAPAIHLGPIYSTPELALIAGNVFSYIVSPKEKLLLKLKEKKQLSPEIYEFRFVPDKKTNFQPGQYMEWTLAHSSPDERGNRRYFTIASSPTENELRLGIRFYDESSSFKKRLLALNPGDEIMAGQCAGDFVLPKNKDKKLVFIAGGIGITPFRSMIKYLSDNNEHRDITLLYSNRTAPEIVYSDIFKEAEAKIGLKTIYTVTQDGTPQDWSGEIRTIDPEMIKKYVPDYKDRIFYISGAYSMITGIKKALRRLGVPSSHIRTDFFPGFA